MRANHWRELQLTGALKRREFLKFMVAAGLVGVDGMSAFTEEYENQHKEGARMGKKIENLRWVPLWISHIGCIKGCLNYLKVDVSTAWLFGATGHAFIINISEGMDVSGPTALNPVMFFKLGNNMGQDKA